MSDEQIRPDHFDEGGPEVEDDAGNRRVITFLSDFGRDDHYAAVMKGVILGINPEVQIVDITHSINPYDIQGGAAVLGAAYHFFPKGTIHLAVVDPGVGGERRGIMAATQRELETVQYFLEKVSSTFHGRDVFAPVAGYLSAGESAEDFGPFIVDPVKLEGVRATVGEGGVIEGKVLFVDVFGNLITNIDTQVFWEGESKAEEDGGRNLPVIEIGGASIHGIGEFYEEARKGELGAHFNSWPLLEVFFPHGNAAEKLGMGKGASVKIRFESES
jgi:S-adenosylmethionine hydrolase